MKITALCARQWIAADDVKAANSVPQGTGVRASDAPAFTDAFFLLRVWGGWRSANQITKNQQS